MIGIIDQFKEQLATVHHTGDSEPMTMRLRPT